MANILVTGGAGYIGSHICKALLQNNHTVIAYDDLSRSTRAPFGKLIQGRVHNYRLLRQTLDDHQIDAVIHMAAYAYVGESTEHPHLYFENNVNGCVWLLEAMRDSGVKNLIFSSSCAVYGASDKPLREDSPTVPINPYGLSKLLCEKMILNAKDWGLKSCALRYFNAAGCDPEGDLMESHDPEPHFIPNLLMAMNKGTPITLLGHDYPTPDGTCIRDFVHAKDLAEAHILTLEALLKKERMESCYNIGSSKGYSLKEVVHTAEELFSRSIHILYAPRRPGDPPSLTTSSKAFSQRFNWKPQLSDLQTILTTARIPK